MRSFVVAVLCLVAVAVAHSDPAVDWGKCPQLEPSESEQQAKGEVIKQCLEKYPPPEAEPSEEEIIAHKESITTCALETEGWFQTDGTYKFERARKEIEDKNLSVASEILEKHEDCTKEAKEKLPGKNIEQVQLYQACMDFHVTKICDIKISGPEN